MNDMKDIFHPIVYIIVYSAGEYEDAYEDNLGFFMHKEDADAMVVKLEAEYADWDGKVPDEDGTLYPNYYSKDYSVGKTIEVSIDYTGPSFRVQTLKNIRHLL